MVMLKRSHSRRCKQADQNILPCTSTPFTYNAASDCRIQRSAQIALSCQQAGSVPEPDFASLCAVPDGHHALPAALKVWLPSVEPKAAL